MIQPQSYNLPSPTLSVTQMETVTKFSQLFAGRTDFLGTEEGGCIRLWEGHGIDLWSGIGHAYQGHLTGSRPPIGIYPVRTEWLADEASVNHKRFVVKFGAVDIDEQDFGLAANLWKALSALGIVGWVEKSRSKGYHVWVFAEEWVPAVLMRSVLQVACDIVGYNPKEIYPKQTELVDGSPGNYIRLPYPGGLGRRYVQMVEDDPATGRYVLEMETSDRGVLELQDFVGRAWENRCPRSVLESAASLAKPIKVRARLVRDYDPSENLDRLVKKMSGLTFTIFRDGPLEGSDRSGTLFKLAALLQQEGFTPEEVRLLVGDLDARIGKFADRPDADQRLWEIVERVFDLS